MHCMNRLREFARQSLTVMKTLSFPLMRNGQGIPGHSPLARTIHE